MKEHSAEWGEDRIGQGIYEKLYSFFAACLVDRETSRPTEDVALRFPGQRPFIVLLAAPSSSESRGFFRNKS